MGRLNVHLLGRELQNPIIPASGCFGYGLEAAAWYDLNRLGAVALKGTTLLPRDGNSLPRIAECPSGMLNSVGLQNPGVEAVIREELPRLREHYRGPVIANASGFSLEEYAEVCRRLDTAEEVSFLEVNISCPNVHGGGMSFGTSPAAAAEVTRAVKAVTRKPVIVKLSPNVTDIREIALACEDAGADALSLINTLLGMRISLSERRPVLGNITGGLSGPAVFPVALRMVWQVYEAVRIPVIGVGGIRSAEDVIEMMLAGASAVEIGAAGLQDPLALMKILDALPKAMDRYEIDVLESIIGGAH